MTIFSEDFLDPRFSFLDILILCNFIIKREKIRLVGAGIYVDGIRVKMEDGGKKLIDWNFFREKEICAFCYERSREIWYLCVWDGWKFISL